MIWIVFLMGAVVYRLGRFSSRWQRENRKHREPNCLTVSVIKKEE